MVESYRIQAVLNLTSNAPAELENLGRRFQQFDKIIKETQGSLKSLETTLKNIGSTRGLGNLTQALERLGRVKLGNIQGLASLGAVTTAIERIAKADSKGLSGLARGLQSLGNINLGTSVAQFDTMARALKTIVTLQGQVATSAHQTATAWQQAASAMQAGAGALRAVGGTPGGQQLAQAQAARAQAQTALAQARLAALPTQQAQQAASAQRAAHRASEHDWVGAGMGASIIGSGIRDRLEAAWNDAMEVQEKTALLGIAGFTPEQMAAAKANAYNVQTNIPGATVVGALEITKDTYAVIRDAKEAIEASGGLAAMGVVLAKEGKGDQTKELFAAVQAGELRGALSDPGSDELSLPRLTKFLNAVETVAVGTGGRIGPKEYLAFLRQSGSPGVQLSDEALFQSMPAVMMAMNSSRAGTALQSFYQSEFGHLMKGYGEEQAKVGMLQPGGLVRGGKGQPDKVLPGGMVNESLALSNFPEWVLTTLSPILANYLDPQHKMSPTQLLSAELRELPNLFPRNTITRYTEDILRNPSLVHKEEAGLDPTKGPMANKDFLKELTATDPKLHLDAFNAAWTAFLASWGEASMGSVIKYLDMFTNGLNAMAKWARENPEMAAQITDAAIALGALATALAGLSLITVTLTPALRLLGGLAALGGATVPAAAGGGIALGAGLPLGVAAVGAGAAVVGGWQLWQSRDRVTGGIDWGGGTGSQDTHGIFGAGPTAAPAPAPQNSKLGSSPANPLFMYGINTPTGRDIAHGATENMANGITQPSAGVTGFDGRAAPALTPLPW